VIRFGLRLAVASGREAVVRLVIIAVAMALGVGMLLTTVAGINGVQTQNDRYGWANSPDVPQAADAPDPLWWHLRVDSYAGITIGRVDLAATGPRSPVPPGLPRLPGPGEFFASPALTRLLGTVPAAQLADRFPGRQVGTVGPAALPSPDSLVAVVGYRAEELAARPGVDRVGTITTTAPAACPGGCWVGIPTEGLQLILVVVALGLIFPLLILIGTATRLAATRREQRFAAMRLVGATPRQVAVVSAVEATVSAAAGTALGFVLFFLFRDRLAAVPFTGAPFFPSDLSLGPVGVLAVAVGVPAAAALAARFALRRVRISPLGVTRRVTPRPPRAYRLIPLLIGVAELGWFVGRRPETTNGQIMAFLPGFLIVMVGLVVAGPWLTMVGARLIARRASRPSTLIAARRLADDPRTGFRAVSGLMLALFVTSVAVGVIGTIVSNRGTATDRTDTANLFMVFRDEETAPTGEVVPGELTAVPGVLSAAVTRRAPEGMPRPQGFFAPDLLASCADVARTPKARPCAAGARTAWVMPDLIGSDQWPGPWPDAGLAPAELAKLPAVSMVVGTDGSERSREAGRTQIENAYPMLWPPATEAEWAAETDRVLTGWKQLAKVVIVISLVIAGCSLAVSVAGGLSERKRPFSMLRLTGVSLGTLRRVVTLESVTPLVAAAVVAIGAGFLSAHLFLRAQLHYSLTTPEVSYFVIVATGLAVSLGVIASTMPMLRRITGPEAARNE
jgi:hypothetical protein